MKDEKGKIPLVSYKQLNEKTGDYDTYNAFSRPYADYILRSLREFYEIIIYSTLPEVLVKTILYKLCKKDVIYGAILH